MAGADRKHRYEEEQRRAWTTIRKLNTDNRPPHRIAAVTPNQIAHQLIVNGRPNNKEQRQKKKQHQEMKTALSNGNNNFPPFTLRELNEEIKQLKSNKAPGIDGIPNEFLEHLGP